MPDSMGCDLHVLSALIPAAAVHVDTNASRGWLKSLYHLRLKSNWLNVSIFNSVGRPRFWQVLGQVPVSSQGTSVSMLLLCLSLSLCTALVFPPSAVARDLQHGSLL